MAYVEDKGQFFEKVREQVIRQHPDATDKEIAEAIKIAMKAKEKPEC